MNLFVGPVDGSGPWRDLGHCSEDGITFEDEDEDEDEDEGRPLLPRPDEVIASSSWPGRVIDGEVVE